MARWMTAAALLLTATMVAGCDAARFVWYKVAPDRPALDGDEKVPGLAATVTIDFDARQVPHVRAETEEDLFLAAGWLHARERLFQMELMRRAASGRLSELFGNQPSGPEAMFADLLATDRWLRVIGLGREGARSVELIDPAVRLLAEKYIDGINAFIENGRLPIEFRLLHQRPEPWTVADLMGVARLLGWELAMNMPQELIRYSLRAELGEALQQEIFPPFDHPGPAIVEPADLDLNQWLGPEGGGPPAGGPADPPVDGSWHGSAGAVLSGYAGLYRNLSNLLPPDASNNWAVGPSRSASGKAIISNDPHLDHAAPGVFYLMRLSAPGFDATGATLPGVPLVVLGRNRTLAWAATTTFADIQDIYLEHVDESDPTRYRIQDGSLPFETLPETIREKLPDGTFRDHPFTVRFTRHGPVLDDAVGRLLPSGTGKVLALRTTMPGAAGEPLALYRLAKAANVADARAALESWRLPIQNWLLADADGHIGYFPAGQVPLRRGWDGTFPVPGWSGGYEWQEYIPSDKLPQLWDPPSGIIVTANNKVFPAGGYPWPYTHDAMPGYRAERIRQLLEARQKLTVDDMLAIQLDVRLAQADRLLPALLTALAPSEMDEREKAARETLAAWDRVCDEGSRGAALFFSTYRAAWELCLKDDLSPELYTTLTTISYAHGFFDRLWADLPDSAIWDRKATPEREGRDDVLRLAFRTAVAELARTRGPDPSGWTWGTIHTLTFEHPFGKERLLASTFNVGPLPMPGARDTVFAASPTWGPDNTFPVRWGPVFRHVTDFGDEEASGMVLDFGQTGWAGTKAYGNAVDDWKHGRLWTMPQDGQTGLPAGGRLRLLPPG